MLIGQIHQEFKILADKSDSLNSANFSPEEIDIILNNSQDQMIRVRTVGDNASSKTGFEETQKRVDDLKNITVGAELITFLTTAENKPNGKFVLLPDGLFIINTATGQPYPKYRFAVNEEATISYLNCNNQTVQKRAKVQRITHNRYNIAVRDPYDQPDTDTIFRLNYGRLSTLLGGPFETVELVTDASSTLVKYHLRYIKEPAQMRFGTTYQVPTTDIQCELSDYLHRELIETAVRIALEDIESQRYKTKLQEQQISQTN